ncbi:GNAT family N-acetyltransferase [Rhodobium gokarnense]|uniref:GNAT superfamily N-acetyltransferase n=1 Tax=Rhodobium gokarnense TaxID=364296 RepID=A0ABT3H5U0_9HYPH|nr:GNAT family N-acetyltransferase [Rhodobium gokarnense]MCW2305763.1 GNAT superfamily N-acetyltransferase [Rhodobium gokarnense]
MAIGYGWVPGIVGEIVRAHAVYYAREWDFGPVFEAKVAGGLAAFLERYDPVRDRLVHAHGGDTFLGSVAIDGSDPELAPGRAHLRWFVVTDAARGRGLGRRLMDEAVRFVRSSGATSCYLDTFAGLDAARHLYEAAGFRLTEEHEATSWGTPVTEQRFVLDVGATAVDTPPSLTRD